jgi:hypothetical protein
VTKDYAFIHRRWLERRITYCLALQTFRERMQGRGVDLDDLNVVDRTQTWKWSATAPSKASRQSSGGFTDDTDWLDYLAAEINLISAENWLHEAQPYQAQRYFNWEEAWCETFQRAHGLACPGSGKEWNALVRAASKVSGGSRDEIAFRRDLAKYRKELKAWCEVLSLPPITLPDGWEGEAPDTAIDSPSDLEAYLSQSLEDHRKSSAFGPICEKPTLRRGCEAVRNAFRAFDALGIPNRPHWGPDATTLVEAERELSNLLAWIRGHIGVSQSGKGANAFFVTPTEARFSPPPCPKCGGRVSVTSGPSKKEPRRRRCKCRVCSHKFKAYPTVDEKVGSHEFM